MGGGQTRIATSPHQKSHQGQFGHLTRMPPNVSQMRFFEYVLTGEGPGGDPGQAGDIVSLGWLKNRNPNRLVRGRSGCLDAAAAI